METNDLTIVIVTFKSEEKIFSCIDSIPSNISIQVVENSDNKAFKTKIEEKYSNVKCLLAGENKGYAVGNNLGLKKVTTKFALILNPDTVLSKNSIRNFFKTVKEINDFWLIGPINDQQISLSSSSNNLIEVNTLKGFAIFFNMEKFKGKFFDENFFLYFEEIDLCNTVLKKGGKIFIDKSIIINHKGASSVNTSKNLELEKNRNWHWMWSTFYYHKKHKGYFLALIIILPKLISSIFKTIFFQLILNKEKKDIYFYRMCGMINSMIGKKSWYRPSLD